MLETNAEILSEFIVCGFKGKLWDKLIRKGIERPPGLMFFPTCKASKKYPEKVCGEFAGKVEILFITFLALLSG